MHIICEAISITNQLKMTLENRPFKIQAKIISISLSTGGKKPSDLREAASSSQLGEVDVQ